MAGETSVKAHPTPAQLEVLNRKAHGNFCVRCLYGLPAALVEADSSRVAVGFYALGALDILGLVETRLKEEDRMAWRAWIWEQQVRRSVVRAEALEEGSASASEAETGNGEGRGGGGGDAKDDEDDEGGDGSIVFATSTSTDDDDDDLEDELGNESSVRRRRKGDTYRVPEPETERATGGGTGTGSGHIGGFRPGPFMHVDRGDSKLKEGTPAAIGGIDTDPPHLIMTYTALLSLAILRDDFAKLDRQGLKGLLRATHLPDGSFTAIPGQGEADLRMVYTAFAICAMLNDWSAIDVPRAIAFIKRCMTYEGGFGQVPGNEAQGGPTYCALAALALVPPEVVKSGPGIGVGAALDAKERARAVRWLVMRQSGRRMAGSVAPSGATDLAVQSDTTVTTVEVGKTNTKINAESPSPSSGSGGGEKEDSGEGKGGRGRMVVVTNLESGSEDDDEDEEDEEKMKQREWEEGIGGLSGRTEKPTDACYSFWCGAALHILDAPMYIERIAHRAFICACQTRRGVVGGLAKTPGAAREGGADPYHTYLALAALALYPAVEESESEGESLRGVGAGASASVGESAGAGESWKLERLDPLLNATEGTAEWVKAKVPVGGHGR